MNKTHIPSLPWEEAKSPTGKFHSFCRNLSLALGGTRNAGTWAGGHPFDLQIRRVPPGAAICPFHSHLAQWEMFVVQSGAGTVRAGDTSYPVATGEVFIHPPGEPHQLINTGTADLEVLIIADNPPLDAFYYPDSNKWGLRPPGKFFKMTEVDYFDGEDDVTQSSHERQPLDTLGALSLSNGRVEPPARSALAATPTYRPAPSPAPPPPAPFSSRKLHVDSLPWEPWDSPKKKYRASSKELSIALGARRNTPTGLGGDNCSSVGGHPFDLELGKVPPGFSGCPLHSHAAQWELYVFLAGTATVRTLEGTTLATAGDVVLHPPMEAHQFTNTGTDDVLYYLVADNPPVDYGCYPDSNKWGIRAPRKFFRMGEIDYWDGEE